MRLSIFALGFVLLGGCTSFSGAPDDRSTLLPPPAMRAEDWPKRDVERARSLTVATPTELFRFQLDGTRGAEQMRPEDVMAATAPIARVKFNDVVGNGTLRVFDELRPGGASGGGGGDAADGGGEGLGGSPTNPDVFAANARFVSSWYLDHPRRAEYELKSQVFEETSNRLLSVVRPGLRYAERSARDLTEEGVAISLPPPPSSPIAPRARGLVVHLSGTAMGQDERPLLDVMEARGWAVIRVGTVTPVNLDAEPIPVMTDTEITRAAITIAEGIDGALAENAYAVEAALAYCAEHRPDLPTRPIILVGCAAGAVALPAVATRLGDKVDAAILVGGGANILDIALRSELEESGIKLDWGQKNTPVERYTELLVQYLTCSRLDPYHTAPYLVDRPVLVVHAVFDAVVPASAGLLLYDRLGKPDRLRFSGGHSALFYFLENNAPKIATWLDGAIQRRVRQQQAATAAAARTRPIDPVPEPPRPPRVGVPLGP